MRKAAILLLALAATLCGCGKKPEANSTDEPQAKLLVGDIAESILPEIGYKRITDSRGASIQGGNQPTHEIFRKDSLVHKPLAIQWAGIKSLEPIPGHGGTTFYRYKVIAELYPDEKSAKHRDQVFDSEYARHAEEGGSAVSKEVIPVIHFPQGRVFYLLTTDMSASSNGNETGRIKFALLKHLTK